MTHSTNRHRRVQMWRGRALPLLTALALPLGLTPAVAAAAPLAPPSHTSAGTQAVGQSSAVTIPDLGPGSRTVTLITGDQVTLTPTGAPGSGHYMVGTRPAARAGGYVPPMPVTTVTSPAGGSQIAATPADAEFYVSSGSVDRGLFDVTYLAGHEAGGQLAVDVRFATPMTDAGLAAAAANLPATTLVQTMDSSNAVEVNVDLAHAGQFWAAIASPGAAGATGGGTLAGGIAAVWLDGHQLGRPGSLVPASDPSYSVTVIIHGRTGARECTNIGITTTVCAASALVGVQGPSAGQVYSPSSESCADSLPVCQSVLLTYDVPAGVYSEVSEVLEYFADYPQWFEADDPQIQVGNDTTVSLALDDASKVTINTPKPAFPFDDYFLSDRTLPDGTQFAAAFLTSSDAPNLWALPTQPVTIGSYAFKTQWVLQQPEIAMSIDAPHAVQLHPYPFALGTAFQGTRKLEVVSAGLGTASDFAGIDARGKLALIATPPDLTAGCTVTPDQLQNALNAGAAGVLVDPANPVASITGVSCVLPLARDPGLPGGMPFADLTYGDAQTLRVRLSQGPVQITVTGTPPPSQYLYELTFFDRGSIPGSETHTVTSENLAAFAANYHYDGSQGSAVEQTFTASESSGEPFVYVTSDPVTSVPNQTQIFLGPVSPDVIWTRDESEATPDFATGLAGGQILNIYDTAGQAPAEDWQAEPSVPGAPVFPATLVQAYAAKYNSPVGLCSGCRQGNDFIPWMYLTSPNPLIEGIHADGWAGQDPGTVQLYADGQQVLPTQNGFGLAEYTLPPQQTQYRLTVGDANSDTTWNFTSAEPATDQAPAGYGCASAVFGITGPCQATPMIFLRYDAGVNLTDAVTAPATHKIGISAIHLDPSAPAVTSLQVWTSVDGGKTWTAAHVTASGSGSYVAAYTVPGVSATDGSVSLKVQATDAGGNDVTQVITDAFHLTGQ